MSSATALVGLDAGLAHRAGGDAGHEVGVGDVDALDAGQVHGPAQGGERVGVGIVAIALVDADGDPAHRQAQLRRARRRPAAPVWWIT